MFGRFPGFTLIELIVTISVIGILAAVSLPSLSKFYSSYQFKNSVTLFESALAQGFSESRSSNKTITIKGLKSADFFWYDGEQTPLFPGVTFRNNFTVIFTPPFGDLQLIDSPEIILGNDKQAQFLINEVSGLVTINPYEPNQALPGNISPPSTP